MTLSADRIEHLRRIAPTGGTARALQFTTQSQRHARHGRSHESIIAAGKAGYAATARKHGRDFALCKAAAYRQAHPTALEQRVIDALAQIGTIDYTREAQIPGTLFYVDFLFESRRLVVEVDGTHWHDPASAPEPGQPARDLVKAQHLQQLGYRLVHLTEFDINRSDFVDLLRSFIYA